jgi:calcineurin-like phosphoesterase
VDVTVDAGMISVVPGPIMVLRIVVGTRASTVVGTGTSTSVVIVFPSLVTVVETGTSIVVDTGTSNVLTTVVGTGTSMVVGRMTSKVDTLTEVRVVRDAIVVREPLIEVVTVKESVSNDTRKWS